MGDGVNSLNNPTEPRYLGSPVPNNNSPAPQNPNLSVTGLAGSLLARRETNMAPFFQKNAFQSYSVLKGSDFADANDIRLTQLNLLAQTINNILKQKLNSILYRFNIGNVDVVGRAKSELSLFNKLMKSPEMTIGNMKDISASRLNLQNSAADWVTHHDLSSKLELELSAGGKVGIKDFIQNPSADGYTGRIHLNIPGGSLSNQEVQIGSQDLAEFIDKNITTAGGSERSLHDLVYKGKQYGIEVPQELGARYKVLMEQITANDKLGLTVAKNPELLQALNNYYQDVSKALPETLPPLSGAELTIAQRIKGIAGRSMGALGIFGGALQSAEGVNELNDGRYIEGGANLASGASSLVSGGALVLGRTLLSAGTGGIAATIDGGRDVYLGVRDGNTEKLATGGVKGLAGGIMMAGVYSANPFIIGAGAATYMGSAIYENRSTLMDGASWAYDKVSSGVGSVWNSIFG